MKELRQQVEKLKQLGTMGGTLAEQMEKLRLTGSAILASLPWVPFDLAGRLKCYAVPVPGGAGYEVIRVNTDGHATFPSEPYREFCLPQIQQTVFMFGGRLEVVVDGASRTLLAGDTIRIPQGAWVRLVYNDVDCVFRQVPRIATGDQDMMLR